MPLGVLAISYNSLNEDRCRLLENTHPIQLCRQFTYTTSEDLTSKSLEFKTRIFHQGDPLSPIIFRMCFIPNS